MPTLNPDRLLEQADRLISAPPPGPPRQVDLRRAISAAYYSLFHLTLTELADEFVGALHRDTSRDALVHRSVDHRAIEDLCLTISKNPPPGIHAAVVPRSGFGHDLLAFAAFVALQTERHRADYDVSARCRTLDARVAIARGRVAVAAFRNPGAAERRMMLLCPPR